jgi:hypothetical protein
VEDSNSLHHHINIPTKLLVFEVPLGVSETFLCSMSALLTEIIFLLGAIQLIIFVGTLDTFGT